MPDHFHVSSHYVAFLIVVVYAVLVISESDSTSETDARDKLSAFNFARAVVFGLSALCGIIGMIMFSHHAFDKASLPRVRLGNMTGSPC